MGKHLTVTSAEIIAIGNELLLGGRTDTNSIFLSEMLAQQGIEVRFKTIVGDDVKNICQSVTIAARRAKVVLITGGLGPTEDDLTREAVSKVTGRNLHRREKALQVIKTRFRRQGRVITKNPIIIAIPKATILEKEVRFILAI